MGDITDLIIIIIGSGLLYFLLIYNVDFHRFIDMNIPGFILSSMFILLYKELLSSLFFILLNNSAINSEGKFYYTGYINGSIYIRDLILNIVL